MIDCGRKTKTITKCNEDEEEGKNKKKIYINPIEYCCVSSVYTHIYIKVSVPTSLQFFAVVAVVFNRNFLSLGQCIIMRFVCLSNIS